MCSVLLSLAAEAVARGFAFHDHSCGTRDHGRLSATYRWGHFTFGEDLFACVYAITNDTGRAMTRAGQMRATRPGVRAVRWWPRSFASPVLCRPQACRGGMVVGGHDRDPVLDRVESVQGAEGLSAVDVGEAPGVAGLLP